MLPYGYALLEKNTKSIMLGVIDMEIGFQSPPKQIKFEGKEYSFDSNVTVPVSYWGTLHRIRKYKLN